MGHARVNYWGLVIAGIGFVLTRFTVTLAFYQDPVRFYLAGVVPLILGLGLAAFGVALAVADVESSLVRTTAVWCVVGVGAMLVLVVLTLVGSSAGDVPDLATARSRAYLSNFLIGGGVGGTLTGLYAARNRRQRDTLGQQANRLSVLNRLLRHEILNAVTIIRGYATLEADHAADAPSVIEERSDAIERTIEEVKFLTPSRGGGELAVQSVDLAASLRGAVASVTREHPGASVSIGDVPDDLSVRANARLDRVFTHLVENAVVHAPDDDPSVDVDVSVAAGRVHVDIRDAGPGLPERQRALLEHGEIGEFDDPESGFGLNVVRLLVESYGGHIETEVDDGGTTVTVSLRRAGAGYGQSAPLSGSVRGVRPATSHLLVTLGAAVLAGAVYGLAAESLGGSVAAIGGFYGFPNPMVGWITHEFHSVVFGFVFAGLLSVAPSSVSGWLGGGATILPDGLRERLAGIDVVAPTGIGDRLAVYVPVGVVWGLVLWLVAAGVVAPVWLQLQGIPAQLPNLTVEFLLYHMAWGVSLAVFTAIGYEYVLPRLRSGLT